MTIAHWISVSQVVVALIAIVVAVEAVRQKCHADDRSAWWPRLQWTLDKITSTDPVERIAGLRLLPTVLQSSLKNADDARLASAIREMRHDLEHYEVNQNVDSEPATEEDS